MSIKSDPDTCSEMRRDGDRAPQAPFFTLGRVMLASFGGQFGFMAGVRRGGV